MPISYKGTPMPPFGGVTRRKDDGKAGKTAEEMVAAILKGAKRLPRTKQRYWVDIGATEEELSTIRSRMLDGDPDTYWQAELAFPHEGPILTFSFHEGKMIPAGDLEQITSLVQSLDPTDMVVTITVDLHETKFATWISLLPANFQEGNWVEVMSVLTATELDSFTEIPGLGAHMNEQILTPEANEDLSAWEATGVMSNGQGFAGQGLWVFPSREMRFVRFILRQPLPIPAPYNVYHATIERDVTQVFSKTRSKKNIFGKARRHTDITTTEHHLETEMELDYERSLILEAGDQEFESLYTTEWKGYTKVTDPGHKSHYVGGIETGGLKYRRSNKGSNTALDIGAWTCTDLTAVTKWDVMRYVIGIRDIQICSYTYEETSTFVSVQYDFPKPLMKIALDVTAIIPDPLLQTDPLRPWIQYYVSLDDDTWYPISPLGYIASCDEEGVDIHQIINIDSELPPEDRNPREGYIESGKGSPYNIRLKAVFNRPAGEEYEGTSPILRSYRLKAYLREGLY